MVRDVQIRMIACLLVLVGLILISWLFPIPLVAAHVVVMPNVTRTKIDRFVDELNACRETFGSIQPLSPDSSLTQLGVPW